MSNNDKTRSGFSVVVLGGAALLCLVIASLNLSEIKHSARDLRTVHTQQQSLNEELLRTVAEGDLIKVRSLVDAGADIQFRDEYGWTPLIQAAAMGNFDVVKYLVIKGADVNTVGGDRSTALQHAVFYDHVAMVRFLIAQGADVKQKAKYDWDAVESANKRGRKKVAHYFEDASQTGE